MNIEKRLEVIEGWIHYLLCLADEYEEASKFTREMSDAKETDREDSV